MSPEGNMLDIKKIRENSKSVKEALKKVGDSDSIDKLLKADERRRSISGRLERLRSSRNTESREIGKMNDPEKRQQKIVSMKEVNDRIKELEVEAKIVEEQFRTLSLSIPNIPDEAAPSGSTEEENVVIEERGTKPKFAFQPKPHWEIGESLEGIDFERGVKISGTRFYILKGQFARLQRALITFMLDIHTMENGFTEVYTPFMVREKCMYGTGQLPKFGDNLYRDVEEDFYFIPTAEVSVTNMYRNEILNADCLPLKHVAYSACFRREKMSAGKESRGIIRGHQFDKVEMVAFTKPEESASVFGELIAAAEKVLAKLRLPYRKLDICTGDLSFTASRKYDLEVWAAGCSQWLEVSSISNFKSFQARRAMIRYRAEEGSKPQYVHTLNGSGLALPRIMIAIIENYQQKDGSIRIPEAVLPYMHGTTEIR